MSTPQPAPPTSPKGDASSTCPRCSQTFSCGAGQGHCDCFELQLSPAQRADLARQYQGCLCLTCLRALAP